MTIYYTLTFGLLVAEMATFGIFLMPMPFQAKKRLFYFLSESPIVAKFAYGLKISFIFVGVLFVDAAQRVFKVTAENDISKQASGTNTTQFESSRAAKKFYAQRNLYLTTFTLFLSAVLTRLYFVLLDNLHVQEEYVKLKKTTADNSRNTAISKDQGATIEQLRKELVTKNKDIEALRKSLPASNKKAD